MESGVRRAGAAAGRRKPFVNRRDCTGREAFFTEKEAIPTESLHAWWLA